MADRTMENSCEESILIQKINYERQKILEVLAHSQMQYPVEVPILKKYLLADRAFLEKLQTPEGVNPLLERPIPSFQNNLQVEIDALCKELSSAVEISQNKQKDIQRLEKRAADLRSVKVLTTVELINSDNIDMIGNKIREELMKEKKELKTVLEGILPEDLDLRNLVANLIGTGVNNPEAYTALENEDGAAEKVALLVKTGLFEIHPTNPLRIRMIDLSD